MSFSAMSGDAIDCMRRIDSGSANLVIADPPYESLEKHRKRGTTTRLKQSRASSNRWFEIFPNDRFPEMFAELYRVMTADSHLYLFCDATTMFVAKPVAEQAGFRFWKPLVWDKMRIGMGYHYRARYELILFFEKGKRKLNDLSVPDVLEFKRIHRGSWPTEKPVDLMRVLIDQSSSKGEHVLDPFMGSGSAGVAAVMAGRRFTGIDLEQESCDLALRRMTDAALE